MLGPRSDGNGLFEFLVGCRLGFCSKLLFDRVCDRLLLTYGRFLAQLEYESGAHMFINCTFRYRMTFGL